MSDVKLAVGKRLSELQSELERLAPLVNHLDSARQVTESMASLLEKHGKAMDEDREEANKSRQADLKAFTKQVNKAEGLIGNLGDALSSRLDAEQSEVKRIGGLVEDATASWKATVDSAEQVVTDFRAVQTAMAAISKDMKVAGIHEALARLESEAAALKSRVEKLVSELEAVTHTLEAHGKALNKLENSVQSRTKAIETAIAEGLESLAEAQEQRLKSIKLMLIFTLLFSIAAFAMGFVGLL